MNLTERQISDMKHAIGYEPRLVDNGVYRAYRNFFAAGKIGSWEILIINGLAGKRKNHIEMYYYVTGRGIEALENILSIKIEQ